MREYAVKRIEKYGIHSRNFNKEACDFIDKLNETLKINLQHALNGGEISLNGYLVDGYDKNKNIIFEYDEPAHNLPKYKKKDEKKQESIVEKVNPTLFIRYDEKNNRLYDIISGNDLK